jgi:hypothetical protein
MKAKPKEEALRLWGEQKSRMEAMSSEEGFVGEGIVEIEISPPMRRVRLMRKR